MFCMTHKTSWICPIHGDTVYQSDFVHQNIRMWQDVIIRTLKNLQNKMELSRYWSNRGTMWWDLETTQLPENNNCQMTTTEFGHTFTVDVVIHRNFKFVSSIWGIVFWQRVLKKKKKSLLPPKTTAAKCFLWFWAFSLQWDDDIVIVIIKIFKSHSPPLSLTHKSDFVRHCKERAVMHQAQNSFQQGISV